jgi:hypothetical protein
MEPSVQLTVDLDAPLRKIVEERAAERGVALDQVIEEAIRAELKLWMKSES